MSGCRKVKASRRGATSQPAVIPKELSDTAWFTERGLAYLRGRGGKPWFLHLGYYRPHPPFIASAPYNAMYRPEDMPKPVRASSAAEEAKQNALLAYYVNNIKQASFFQDGKALGSEMTEEQIAQMRATYCGLMSEIDDHLGRVFDYLKETGQWDDTLIVFTCDHGEQSGDHHLLGKIGYFDESYRIPMIVRDPSAEANATRGTIVEKFTETIDTMPTILEWLGLAGAAPVRRPLAAAVLRRRSRRPTGGPKCTTSTISATCTTASRNRRWACRWTNAVSPSCRTRTTSTSTSPPCRRCSSTSRPIPASS